MKLFISFLFVCFFGIACTSSVSNSPLPTYVPSIKCDNAKQYNFVAQGFNGTGKSSARDWVAANPSVVILGGRYIGLVYILTVCHDN